MVPPFVPFGRSIWDAVRSGIIKIGRGIRVAARYLGLAVLEVLGDVLLRFLVFIVTRAVTAAARLLAN